MKKRIQTALLLCLLPVLMASNCQSSGPDFDNPYDNPDLNPPDTTSEVENLDPNSIVGIHNNVFRPTCANSGCHDGTFEPDFRNIMSSFNTLVMRPIIKNNPEGDFQFRVVPNEANQSILIERLVNDIDGISGIMPLAVDPGSDWDANKDGYIQNIKNWINNGALDPFGNPFDADNAKPQMIGVRAFSQGELLERLPGNGPILLPVGENTITLELAFSDIETSSSQLTVNEIRFSTIADDTENQSPEIMSTSIQKEGIGYFGDTVLYTHTVTINDAQSYGNIEDIVYFRAKVQDELPEPTSIPTNASFDYIKTYFSFTIQ